MGTMNRIDTVECDEISGLSGLIEGYTFKPYCQYSQFDRRILSEAFLQEIENTAAHPENYLVAVKENNRPVAFCLARKSNIESEVFNKKIYSITHLVSGGSYRDSLSNKRKLLRFLSLHDNGNIDLISCRANSEDLSTIHALEKETYHYMDSLITYSIDPKQPRPQQKVHPYHIRPARGEDGTILKKIIRDSQFIDRFHNDPHIPREESDRLYETFIENAMNRAGADSVLVAECNGKLAGFNTIETQNRLYSTFGIKIGSFVLNAVAPEFRSRGIYSSLINESLLYIEDSADLVEIRTHAGNYPVHRALPRIGFRLSLSQLTFHAWNSGLGGNNPNGDKA
jgi:hypothetical protein